MPAPRGGPRSTFVLLYKCIQLSVDRSHLCSLFFGGRGYVHLNANINGRLHVPSMQLRCTVYHVFQSGRDDDHFIPIAFCKVNASFSSRVSLAIIQASTNCRDANKALIRAASEKRSDTARDLCFLRVHLLLHAVARVGTRKHKCHICIFFFRRSTSAAFGRQVFGFVRAHLRAANLLPGLKLKNIPGNAAIKCPNHSQIR